MILTERRSIHAQKSTGSATHSTQDIAPDGKTDATKEKVTET